VLLPSLNGDTTDVDRLVKVLDLPARLVALPKASEARLSALRRSFVETRGRVLRTMSTGGAPGAEGLPVLKGVGPEGT
jgi:hypothetical protein